MRLLRQGPVARLFVGTALNALGSWATLIALWGYAGAHFHQGPDGIALIGLSWGLPAAVISPLAGVPVDRFGPRNTLLVSNAIGMVAAIGMIAAGTFPVLVGLSFLAGLVQAFGRPAAMALPARLVDPADLLPANALLGAAEQSSMVFGPVVGAAAIVGWGIRGAFAVDAITFVVGAAAVASLTLRPRIGPEVASGAGAWEELRAGLALARRLVIVRRALLLAVVSFLSWGAFFVVEPLYVRTVLHRSPAVLGLLQTSFGIGLVLSSLVLPRLGDRMVSLRALALTMIASGAAAALYVGTRSIAVAFVGVGAWGVGAAFLLVPLQTLLQRATPEAAQGRILSLSATADGIGNTATIPVAGVLASAIGVQLTGVAVGLLLAAAGIGALIWFERRPIIEPVPMAGPLAEVDGNRTRRCGIAAANRFEGGGGHQALEHLRQQT